MKYNSIKLHKRFHQILLVLIILLAAFLRFWRIDEIFDIIELHQTYPIFILNDIIREGLINYIFAHPILIRYPGPLSLLLQVPFFYFLGQNTFALKLPFAIAGMLTIVFLYLFTKNFYGEKEALLASFIMAILPGHVILSTIPLPYIFPPFFVALSLYLFYEYYRTGRSHYLYLGGAVSGIGVMMRISFLFFLVPFILTIFAFKGWSFIKKSFKKLMIAFLFFILAGGYPLMLLHLNQYLESTQWWIRDRFPITQGGEDLRDIMGNLERGFIHRFPEFLKTYYYMKGYCHRNYSEIFNFYNVFLSALISILVIELSKMYLFLKTSTNMKNRNLFSGIHSYWMTHPTIKKCFFIIICQFSILALTSLVATGVFHIEEYVMTTPFISIIIGKGIYEILKIHTKPNIILFIFTIIFTIILTCLTIIYAVYPFLDGFFNRSPEPCVSHIHELVKIINKTTNSSYIAGDDVLFTDALSWYGLNAPPGHFLFTWEKGEYVTKSLIKDVLDDKTVLYVFQPIECAKRPDIREMFQEEVVRNNRTLIKERDIVFGTLNYSLYRVI